MKARDANDETILDSGTGSQQISKENLVNKQFWTLIFSVAKLYLGLDTTRREGT